MSKGSRDQVAESEKIILSELKKNANLSVNDIANKHGFSRQKIWRIKKDLEQRNIIWGYSTVVDEKKRGYKNYIVFVRRTSKPLDDTIAEKLTNQNIDELLPDDINIDIESMYLVYGTYDWIFSIFVKDLLETRRFCEILNACCGDSVQDIQFVEVVKTIKKDWISNPTLKDVKTFL